MMRPEKFRLLRELLRDHPTLTDEAIARRVGCSKTTVGRHRYLAGLPKSVEPEPEVVPPDFSHVTIQHSAHDSARHLAQLCSDQLPGSTLQDWELHLPDMASVLVCTPDTHPTALHWHHESDRDWNQAAYQLCKELLPRPMRNPEYGNREANLYPNPGTGSVQMLKVELGIAHVGRPSKQGMGTKLYAGATRASASPRECATHLQTHTTISAIGQPGALPKVTQTTTETPKDTK